MVPHPAPETSTTMRLSFLRPSAGSLPTGLSTGHHVRCPGRPTGPAHLCTARFYYYLLYNAELTPQKRTCKHGLPAGQVWLLVMSL